MATQSERLARLEEWAEGHEARCEDRLTGIHASISDLKLGLKWVIALLVGLLISVAGYALTEVRAADQARLEAVSNAQER